MSPGMKASPACQRLTARLSRRSGAPNATSAPSTTAVSPASSSKAVSPARSKRTFTASVCSTAAGGGPQSAASRPAARTWHRA